MRVVSIIGLAQMKIGVTMALPLALTTFVPTFPVRMVFLRAPPAIILTTCNEHHRLDTRLGGGSEDESESSTGSPATSASAVQSASNGAERNIEVILIDDDNAENPPGSPRGLMTKFLRRRTLKMT
jgi:hypothetical protein